VLMLSQLVRWLRHERTAHLIFHPTFAFNRFHAKRSLPGESITIEKADFRYLNAAAPDIGRVRHWNRKR
jgi:hypothetical protein